MPGQLRSDRRSRDRGSATIVGAVAAAAMLAIALLVVQLGAAAIARHRAATAVDLAAIAGALLVLHGQSTACARAATLTETNGTRLDSCEVIGMDVLVTGSVGAGMFGGRATARARAGPGPP